ncbi:hypothetical protein [Pseudokineococcus sp. 1T1Z-3]|uniref:hypothetical protein n=1 Tax=Pseudokineococcus sp. 1T1Z-3 TaxID=3132745 RepID=UPI0030A7EEF0
MELLRRHPGAVSLLAVVIAVIVVRTLLAVVAPGLPYLAGLGVSLVTAVAVGALVRRSLEAGGDGRSPGDDGGRPPS